MESESLPLDTVYGLLAEARRRYLLYYFLEHEQANVESLSLQIAAWERDSSIEAVTETEKERVTTALIHSHLPKLEAHGLVEYDGRTGDVIVDDAFDEMRETVRRARSTEGDVPITGSSMEAFLYSEPVPSSNTDRQQ